MTGRPDDELRGVVDPDVDLHDAPQRAETTPRQWDLLLAISAGGVVGAEGRYGVGQLIGHGSTQFPWSTVLVNATGCLLIGLLMVALGELLRPRRLLRPFFGVGILGGYTTYSTFALDTQRLVLAHRPFVALGYVLATTVSCALAVWLATTAAQTGCRLIATRMRPREESAPVS